MVKDPSSLLDRRSRRPVTWQPSHRELLHPLGVPARPGSAAPEGPGAVVIPTCRPAEHPRSGIAFGAELALAAGRPLVLLCSGEAATEEALTAFRTQLSPQVDEGLDVLVVAPRGVLAEETTFEVDALELSVAYRRGGRVATESRLTVTDVGRKRNLALLLALTLGWREILLLDDDISAWPAPHHGASPVRTLDPASLAAAVTAVRDGRHAAVGWVARDYADNSVLCRIRSELLLPQDQFIGAGALLVGVDATTPFFPSIYNHDWIFLLGLAVDWPGPEPFAEAGDVRQDPYAGFTRERARSEELGDILGEGLLTLSGTARTRLDLHAGAEFWSEAVYERRGLVQDLQRQVKASSHPLKADMLAALAAAQDVHRELRRNESHWFECFARYTDVLRGDLKTWSETLTAALGRDPAPALEGRSEVLGKGRTVVEFLDRHRRAPGRVSSDEPSQASCLLARQDRPAG